MLTEAGITLAPLVHPERPGEAPAADAPVVLHPGSGGEAKCWPLERWLDLAGRLTARGQDALLIFGEAEAHRWTDPQRAEVDAAGGRGLATLETLVEVLLQAHRYVGHDAGPTHLAAQLGVPTVALFGPTDPRVWAPVGVDVRVIAPDVPCGMDWLEVDQAELALRA